MTFSHLVDSSADSSFITDVKCVTNNQLKSASSIKPECHEQLIRWSNAVVMIGAVLQLVLNLYNDSNSIASYVSTCHCEMLGCWLVI